MNLERLERKVLRAPGASARLREIEAELRLAVALTALRESAGLTQREVAERMGVSQPRVAAIEKCRNLTLAVLDQFVSAVGGGLEVSAVREGRRIPLLPAAR